MVKTRICMRFSFPAVLGIILCTDTKGTALLCLLACALHEMGHIAVMCITGRPPEKITLYGGGMKLTGGGKSIPVIISGCAVNFLLFAAFYFFTAYYNLRLFGVINLLTGLFNLMPVQPFDGYNLLERLMIRLLAPERVMTALRVTEIIACAVAAPLIIMFFLEGNVNFSSVVFLFYLFVVDIIEKM